MRATDQEIKTAFRQLALKYHPDKNKQDGAEDKFKLVTEAYTVLMDKTQRRTYDFSLHF
jgi:DnaJ-class molecular chaperone